MTMGLIAATLAAHVMLPLSFLPAAEPPTSVLPATAAPLPAASACDLVTIGEAATVLGGTPSMPFPMPESFDEESGARMSGCVFERGEMGIVIAIADFDSRAGAEQAMAILAAGEDDEDSIRLSPQSGLGERSLWGSSPDGAIWVTLHGRQILTVTLFGEISNPAAYEERMKSLATSVLSRM